MVFMPQFEIGHLINTNQKCSSSNNLLGNFNEIQFFQSEIIRILCQKPIHWYWNKDTGPTM